MTSGVYVRTEETKRKMSENHVHVGMTGKTHSEETKLKMSKKTFTRELKNKMAIALQKHHIDLSHDNNDESNIIMLKIGLHNRCHTYAYHYIIEKFGIEEIHKYIEWFKNKMKLELTAQNDGTYEEKKKQMYKRHK